VKCHLKPLAIAASATQSDYTRLDVVLIMLVTLYHKFSCPDLDQTVAKAVLCSLEKRWAKADCPVFILAVVLHPFLQLSCFSPQNPYRQFSTLWALVQSTYHRIALVEPNNNFCKAFHSYVSNTGEWSDEGMSLRGHKEQAKKEKKPVNLLQIWRELDFITVGLIPTLNGTSGLIHLALTLLSVVPNSAATERVFSQFGIIHSCLRNRLSLEKVCKQALIRSNMIAQYSSIHHVKRKFMEPDSDKESATQSSSLSLTTASQVTSASSSSS
ncbi:hypothetical protein PAXRUDRAFT_98327, partial [Paxillus rubicundulus Ve08.2h10]